MIDPQTRKGRVAVELRPVPQGARPGQLTRVTFTTQKTVGLIVPFASLQRDGQGAFVYRIDDQSITRRIAVRTGLQLGDKLEILEGLLEGDRVVLNGLINMQDGSSVRLGDVANIRDTHGAEQLRIRVDGTPGVKLSIQKQPQANTVAVVDAVLHHVDWMKSQNLLPEDIQIRRVNDQAVFIRHALRNAVYAALSGATLAMTVVYLFLGNLRRMLIISTAIPLAILVTFMLMQWGGLTLNIMTLGGLALGIRILVDNTIVMLENTNRHQQLGEAGPDGAVEAAAEVNSPIIASTTTNLAAVVPLLFISGLVGLIFRELIFTISAAIAASMIVALTLVPALAARVPNTSPSRLR